MDPTRWILEPQDIIFVFVFYSNFLKSAPNPSLSWFFLAQKKRQKVGEFHHPEVDACFVLFRNDRMKTLQPLPLYWLVRDPGSLEWFSHGETFATNSSRFHLRVRSVVAYLSTQNGHPVAPRQDASGIKTCHNFRCLCLIWQPKKTTQQKATKILGSSTKAPYKTHHFRRYSSILSTPFSVSVLFLFFIPLGGKVPKVKCGVW